MESSLTISVAVVVEERKKERNIVPSVYAGVEVHCSAVWMVSDSR